MTDFAQLDDGNTYALLDDGLWHQVLDVDTFYALGGDWGAVFQYGELPGSLGDPVGGGGPPPAPYVVEQPPADAPGYATTPAGQPLAPDGLPEFVGLPDGRVFVEDNGSYRYVPDVATFTAAGFKWEWIVWLEELPAAAGAAAPTVGPAIPSVAAPPPPPLYTPGADTSPSEDETRVFGTIIRVGGGDFGGSGLGGYGLPPTRNGKPTVQGGWSAVIDKLARGLPGDAHAASAAADRFLDAVQ